MPHTAHSPNPILPVSGLFRLGSGAQVPSLPFLRYGLLTGAVNDPDGSGSSVGSSLDTGKTGTDSGDRLADTSVSLRLKKLILKGLGHFGLSSSPKPSSGSRHEFNSKDQNRTAGPDWTGPE